MRWPALGVLLTLVACSGPSRSVDHSQRVVYRVQDLTQSTPRVTTDQIDVASPLLARTLTRDGGASLGGLAWSSDASYLVAPDGTVKTIAKVAPQFAGVALGLDVALASAERHHLVTRGRKGQVLDRDCTWWLSHDPLDSGPLTSAAAGDNAETCVSSAGLLLEERWSIAGKLVRHRTAIRVDHGPALTGASLYDGKTPAPVADARGLEQVKEIPVETLVKALGVVAPKAPFGLAPDRSTAVISAGADGTVDVEGGVLSWTDGKRLVVLRMERGLTRLLSVGSGGVAVGGVRLTPVPTGLQVRLAGGQGLVATITANVPEDDLLAWVSTLQLS